MLNIFVNTWGNYNHNGADFGEWVKLPMDEEELKKKLKTITKIMGDDDPEFFVNDYEWTTEIEGRKIGENENIFELNEYIRKLDNLDEWEQKIYCAAVEVWGHEWVDIDNLDEFNLMEDVENEYDFGYYWAVDSGCYDLDKMGVLAQYIDYEAFGRTITFETDGGFSSFGWIERC